MNITETIKILEDLKNKYGDISVVCITPESPDFSQNELTEEYCRIHPNSSLLKRTANTKTDRVLIIGM